jgi:TonB family protein
MTERVNGSESRELPTIDLLAPSQVSETVQSLITSTGSTSGEGQNPLLSAITVAALELTEATGAALALKTDEGVVCLARAGETAPPLGTVLGTDSGISGECFRSGVAQCCRDAFADPRVDAEASERLGVRSLAVVPLSDTAGVLGILEVFSDRAEAFGESHIALLGQLGLIAFSRRRSEPEPALPVFVEQEAAEDFSASASFPPVSTSVFQERELETKPNPRVRIAAFAAALLVFVLSLGWVANRILRKPTSSVASQKTAADLQSPASSSAATVVTPNPIAGPDSSKLQTNPAAAEVVVRASNVQPLRKQSAGQVSAHDSAAEPPAKPESVASEAVDTTEISKALAEIQKNPAQVPSTIVAPAAQMPANTLPVSQGISGGTLVHSVPPIYPDSARRQKIEGEVVLEGVVDVNGTLHDLSLVRGDPVLAGAAKQAVTQWRYAPYLLNGKPISMRTSITIRFTLPR